MKKESRSCRSQKEEKKGGARRLRRAATWDVSGMQQERTGGPCDQSGSEDENDAAGSKDNDKAESPLPEERHEVQCEEIAEDGRGPCERAGRASRQQQARKNRFLYLLSWRCMFQRSRSSYPPWPRSFGRKAYGWTDGEGSSRRRGGSIPLKHRRGNR